MNIIKNEKSSIMIAKEEKKLSLFVGNIIT